MNFQYFKITPNLDAKTWIISLNQPQKHNALDTTFWQELPILVQTVNQEKSIRSVILTSEGKNFSSGLDLKDFFAQNISIFQEENAQNRLDLLTLIKNMQASIQAIADSSKIWIAAINGFCIGGGLDVIAACDIRFCSQNATFSLKEAQVGIIADLGSLQRLPSIIGQGNTRLMAFTAADYSAQSALAMQLVSLVTENPEKLMEESLKIALQIANNSGIAVAGSKKMLNYMLDHSPEEGLDYVANWNASFLNNPDLKEAISAFMEKRKPNFK